MEPIFLWKFQHHIDEVKNKLYYKGSLEQNRHNLKQNSPIHPKSVLGSVL